jgi:uncharacterized protein YaiI (UPF0178 family)
MVLAKQAKCLSPDGREFRPDSIGFLLEERELKAKYRRSGGRTRGPKKRTEKNDRRFEAGLESIIKKNKGTPKVKGKLREHHIKFRRTIVGIEVK